MGNVPPLVTDKGVKYHPDADVDSMSPVSKKKFRTAMRQRKKHQSINLFILVFVVKQWCAGKCIQLIFIDITVDILKHDYDTFYKSFYILHFSSDGLKKRPKGKRKQEETQS